jgi:hypothetical protein
MSVEVTNYTISAETSLSFEEAVEKARERLGRRATACSPR